MAQYMSRAREVAKMTPNQNFTVLSKKRARPLPFFNFLLYECVRSTENFTVAHVHINDCSLLWIMIDRQRPPVSWMRDGYVARAGSLLASLVARFSARATYPSLIQLTLVAFDFFLFSVPCLPFLHLSAQRRFFFEQPSEPTEGLSNIFRVLDNLCFNALVEFTRFRKNA